MRKVSTLALSMLFGAASMQAQTFVNSSVLLTHNASSGGCMAVTDMDDDGLDDIVQLDMSTHVYVLYQNPDHTFVTYDYGVVDSGSQWGWAIADIDNDGHKDIVSGVSVTRYLRISARGVYTLSNLNGPVIFTQGMSIGDMNNDGRLDVFACHDNGPPNIWFTDVNGVPQTNNAYIDWSTNPASDMSGNYGSSFVDFDNDGDQDFYISHCRQGVNDPNDPRRWNRLFVNDGTNHFTDQAAAYGLDNHFQTWTTDFGDYDNDGDMDAVSTNHDNTIMLFENDGTGHFTEVTAGCGMEVTGFFLQSRFSDFDNDGFLDVLTSSAFHYFKGHGDGTFTEINGLFPAGKTMHSFAVGDLNNDGFEDVYAGYGDNYVDGDASFPDRLWIQQPNGNHWFNVHLKGVISNKDAVGARVTITGPWGTQIREVRAGESYGLVHTGTAHFGLGAETQVTSLTIHWPSGLTEQFNNLTADQNITVVEGTCISPSAQIATPDGTVLCTGGSPVTLTANPGYTYLWNTTETAQSIVVSAGGTYSVTIDDGSGCSGSASTSVVLDPDQTPSVALSGETTFCQGGVLTLSSSSASGYTWSTSASTQSIDVTASGSYSVTVSGTCADFTSSVVDVTVLPVPSAPVSSNVNLPAPGTADLNATGANVQWYDVPSGGTAIGSGNTWTTPFLNSTTSFWCADETQYGGAQSYGSQTDNTTVGQYHSANTYYLLFDAYQPFILRSVKVYANGLADRDITLVDYSSGTTMTTGTFSIPDGESRVQLNFAVPAGGPYGLRITSANPQLWRDGNGSNPAFPFALSTLGSVTGTNVAGGNALEYYYFFYDWEVEETSIYCSSDRTEVNVDVAVGVNDVDANDGLSVWPNPASEVVNVVFTAKTLSVELLDITGRTVLSRTADAQAVNNGTLSLDVSGLAGGEYTLRAVTGAGIATRRVVVR